jgi:hypothetical protein
MIPLSKSHLLLPLSSGMLLTGQTESLFQITPKQSIKILMAYHPQATKQHLCFETAWGEQKARKTKGVREARTMGIKDALQCIGGIQVLFPLFSHLNPLSLLQQTSLYDDDGKTEVDSSLICLALSFVATMLSDSPSSLEAMLRCDGVHVLGLLFEKITPACWSKEAIAALEQLAHALSSNGTNPRLLLLLASPFLTCPLSLLITHSLSHSF